MRGRGHERLLGGDPHGYKQSIESSMRQPRQPGLLATRHHRVSVFVSFPRARCSAFFLVQSATFRRIPWICGRNGDTGEHAHTRCLAGWRLSRTPSIGRTSLLVALATLTRIPGLIEAERERRTLCT